MNASRLPGGDPAVFAQLQQRLLHLTGQLEALQSQVNRVAAEMEQERSQLAALVSHLVIEAEAPAPDLDRRLVEFTEQLSADHDQLIALSQQLTEVATQDQLVRLATLVATQQQVAELAESLRELSRAHVREQETEELRGRQVRDLLTTVQAMLTRRSQIEERQVVVDQPRLEEMRREARGEFAAVFLPALDGIEAVLDEGRALLTRHRQELADTGQTPDRGAAGGGIVQRIRTRLTGEGDAPDAGTHGPPHPPPPETQGGAAQAINGWLRGLALVRDRFLALMAQEGIVAIPVARQRFDPRVHLAVQSEPRNDVPPDTIVREVRRGFRQGNRVLRYAEVVVARPLLPPTPAGPPPATSGSPPAA
jgi:molecular chaperone GrpE